LIKKRKKSTAPLGGREGGGPSRGGGAIEKTWAVRKKVPAAFRKGEKEGHKPWGREAGLSKNPPTKQREGPP